MIFRLNDTPDTLVAFVAFERVTKRDFDEVVMPASGELVQRTGKLNYLLVIGDPIEKSSLDKSVHAALPALSRWNRAGIVSDASHTKWLAKLFHKTIPVHFRMFDSRATSRAVKWVGEQI